jgi:hypothetical protein
MDVDCVLSHRCLLCPSHVGAVPVRAHSARPIQQQRGWAGLPCRAVSTAAGRSWWQWTSADMPPSGYNPLRAWDRVSMSAIMGTHMIRATLSPLPLPSMSLVPLPQPPRAGGVHPILLSVVQLEGRVRNSTGDVSGALACFQRVVDGYSALRRPPPLAKAASGTGLAASVKGSSTPVPTAGNAWDGLELPAASAW